MIHQWNRALLEGASGVFERGAGRHRKSTKSRSKNSTPRLGSWPSPKILWQESSNPGPASEAQDD
jgi:transposase